MIHLLVHLSNAQEQDQRTKPGPEVGRLKSTFMFGTKSHQQPTAPICILEELQERLEKRRAKLQTEEYQYPGHRY